MADPPDPGPRGWRGLLGRKVSVRYRLHDDPHHGHSEALGVVKSVSTEPGDNPEVELVTRSARVVSFCVGDITHMKVFD